MFGSANACIKNAPNASAGAGRSTRSTIWPSVTVSCISSPPVPSSSMPWLPLAVIDGDDLPNRLAPLRQHSRARLRLLDGTFVLGLVTGQKSRHQVRQHRTGDARRLAGQKHQAAKIGEPLRPLRLFGG